MAFSSSPPKESSVLQYGPLIWAHKCDMGGELGGPAQYRGIGTVRVNDCLRHAMMYGFIQARLEKLRSTFGHPDTVNASVVALNFYGHIIS